MSPKKSVREQQASAGLPQTGEPASPLEEGFVVIGKFRRPHGVRGDILMEVMTSFPERIMPGKHVFAGKNYQKLTITGVRTHHVGLIVQLEGYESPENSGELRNQMVYVPIGELPELPEGEMYIHDLIGMDVITLEGLLLGQLSEIMETGANDVLIIHDEDGNETLLPDIESVVLEVDLEGKQIIVQPPEWY